MLKDKYLQEITRTVRAVADGKAVKAFVFGSSIHKDTFGDCDVGVMGEVTDAQVRALKERFAESTLPYKVSGCGQFQYGHAGISRKCDARKSNMDTTLTLKLADFNSKPS